MRERAFRPNVRASFRHSVQDRFILQNAGPLADASGLPPICSDCVGAEGLCSRCAKSVLPQLKKPSWIWLLYYQYFATEAEKALKASAAATRRTEQQNARRAQQLELQRSNRMRRLIAGDYAPARRAA